MDNQAEENKLDDIRLEQGRIEQELSFLFGEDIVHQASLIDAVDLKLNDDMTRFISDGVTQLKKMKDQPESQKDFIQKMAAGQRLVLCMWIMEMGLLEKLQSHSYVRS